MIFYNLSLFSRDLIAQATAIGLSHNTFDATLLLGICDKIALGQLMGALSFGHLPTAFVPSGPMGTKISNKYKVQVRQQYAAGLIGKDELQTMENDSYHSVGTCTFYGTANTNQLVFEAMGLMLPGSAFVPVNSKLREKLTALCAKQMLKIQSSGKLGSSELQAQIPCYIRVLLNSEIQLGTKLGTKKFTALECC